ncbi:MAG TPA: UPF0280 family protein [Candidatus Altiarchaeales archaeon]|nr:UPF0280 family protein [Candidatus Altiarchaeales archaeon]
MRTLRFSLPDEGVVEKGFLKVKDEFEYRDTRIRLESDFEGQLDVALEAVIECWRVLEKYFRKNPLFQSSYAPVEVESGEHVIIERMNGASRLVGTGPMASVAGAIAEYVGEKILGSGAGEVVVENGGDIYLNLKSARRVGVYAGDSKFSNKLFFEINPKETPLGVCTSAASVGHSVSLGRADALVCVSKSAALADASATYLANLAGEVDSKDLPNFAREIRGLDGFLGIVEDELTAWGRLPELSGI